MFDSNTSFQFGLDDKSLPSGPYTPLSKLAYSLDSTWAGLRVGVRKPDRDIHFEWLTPIAQGINGGMSDYDWNIDDSHHRIRPTNRSWRVPLDRLRRAGQFRSDVTHGIPAFLQVGRKGPLEFLGMGRL
jgi:hypothetical protein